MGHRGYVAYEQPNGKFNVHFTYWGAAALELCTRIDETTPWGGPNDLEPPFLMELTNELAEQAEEHGGHVEGAATEPQDTTCVRQTPERSNLSMREVVEMCEEHDIESLYVVEQDFTVHGYKTEHIRFGDEYRGVFIYAPKFNDDGEPQGLSYIRGLVRGVKSQLTALVDDGIITADEAHEQFLATTLNKFDSVSGKEVLAQSTAITEEAFTSHIGAFLDAARITNLFGVMVPVKYDDVEPWKVPDEYTLPPAFDEFEEHLKELSLDDAGGNQQTLGSFDPSDTGSALDRPADEDLPSVTLSSDPDDDGILVDGELYYPSMLPDHLHEAYRDYEQGVKGPGIGYTNVHECSDCREREDGYEHGYLTTSSNIDEYKNPYSCQRSWREERISPHALAGRHSPEAWDVALTVNGETTRVIDDDDDTDSQREYDVIVRRMEEYEYNGEVREETRVTLTAPSDFDGGVMPTETITGETAGDEWEATISFGSESASVEWHRIDENGDPLRYAYREETVDGQKEYEPLGFLPLPDVDTDADNVTVETLDSSVSSSVMSRECESTDFDRVWPPDRYLDKTVNVHAVSADQVPNTNQHLSKMQSEVTDFLDTDELLTRSAIAAYHIWDVYGHPSESGRDGIVGSYQGDISNIGSSVSAD